LDDYLERYFWLLHTTSFSGVNEHKHKRAGRKQFSNECVAAFREPMLSELDPRLAWVQREQKAASKDARFGAHFTQMYTFSTDPYRQAQLDALEAGTEAGRRNG
jgi:hypothetical protein